MTKRINPYARMDLIQPLIDYSHGVPDVGLEPALAHLVKIRASQINGCAVCLVMHSQEARQDGETEMRIYLLDAWTEALTTLDHATSDAAYELVAAEFSEAEQVVLTLLIGNINTWNRINAGFRVSPPRSSAIKAAA